MAKLKPFETRTVYPAEQVKLRLDQLFNPCQRKVGDMSEIYQKVLPTKSVLSKSNVTFTVFSKFICDYEDNTHITLLRHCKPRK